MVRYKQRRPGQTETASAKYRRRCELFLHWTTPYRLNKNLKRLLSTADLVYAFSRKLQSICKENHIHFLKCSFTLTLETIKFRIPMITYLPRHRTTIPETIHQVCVIQADQKQTDSFASEKIWNRKNRCCRNRERNVLSRKNKTTLGNPGDWLSKANSPLIGQLATD